MIAFSCAASLPVFKVFSLHKAIYFNANLCPSCLHPYPLCSPSSPPLKGTVIVGNEIHGLKVKHLHVGGVLGSGEVQNGIRGCIQVRKSELNF